MLAKGHLCCKGSTGGVDLWRQFAPGTAFAYDFAGYTVQLVHLEQGRNGKHLATFVVKKPTAPLR
ncbi:MAG: hypothetical protein R3E79_33650 [Caldilineaceae bacterium]